MAAILDFTATKMGKHENNFRNCCSTLNSVNIEILLMFLTQFVVFFINFII